MSNINSSGFNPLNLTSNPNRLWCDASFIPNDDSAGSEKVDTEVRRQWHTLKSGRSETPQINRWNTRYARSWDAAISRDRNRPQKKEPEEIFKSDGAAIARSLISMPPTISPERPSELGDYIVEDSKMKIGGSIAATPPFNLVAIFAACSSNSYDEVGSDSREDTTSICFGEECTPDMPDFELPKEGVAHKIIRTNNQGMAHRGDYDFRVTSESGAPLSFARIHLFVDQDYDYLAVAQDTDNEHFPAWQEGSFANSSASAALTSGDLHTTELPIKGFINFILNVVKEGKEVYEIADQDQGEFLSEEENRNCYCMTPDALANSTVGIPAGILLFTAGHGNPVIEEVRTHATTLIKDIYLMYIREKYGDQPGYEVCVPKTISPICNDTGSTELVCDINNEIDMQLAWGGTTAFDNESIPVWQLMGSCTPSSGSECTTPIERSCFDATAIKEYDPCTGEERHIPCTPPEYCESGFCVEDIVTECQDECHESEWGNCTLGNAYQECGDFDLDDCLEWGTVGICQDGYDCDIGLGCIPDGTTTCQDECSPGQTRCSGNFIEECANVDADECPEWNIAYACDSGFHCEEGNCVEGTTTECDLTEDCSISDCIFADDFSPESNLDEECRWRVPQGAPTIQNGALYLQAGDTAGTTYNTMPNCHDGFKIQMELYLNPNSKLIMVSYGLVTLTFDTGDQYESKVSCSRDRWNDDIADLGSVLFDYPHTITLNIGAREIFFEGPRRQVDVSVQEVYQGELSCESDTDDTLSLAHFTAAQGEAIINSLQISCRTPAK